MAQSIPDRSIINELAVGYLDAYYSTDKLAPLPSENGTAAKEPVKTKGDNKPAKNGAAKRHGVKNGGTAH